MSEPISFHPFGWIGSLDLFSSKYFEVKMIMNKNFKNIFNSPDTLGIISSYPARRGEVAIDNAISRYTKLIVKNFPADQKVIVFCEKKRGIKPYLESENVLIVPTYEVNSLKFFNEVASRIFEYSRVKNILFQFEFSIFGGKIVTPQILALLLFFKIFGRSVKMVFHQVVMDLNTLSGHLAIKKGGFKAFVLTNFLKTFYFFAGKLIDKAFVHDSLLAKRLSYLVDSKKIKIIPHGVSKENKFTEKYIEESKKNFGVDGKTKLVGIFGYCSWYKGTDWLIENFAKFVSKNPGIKIRLLVAGGESPTLKGTGAYKRYHKTFRKVIKEANGNIIYTGYVSDKDVKKVFAAVDLFVFPYRTRMSASGAFSLCVGFQKPFIGSKEFSESISDGKSDGRVFALNYNDFEKVLKLNLKSRNGSIVNIGESSWSVAALKYLKEGLSDTSPNTRYEYAEAI